MSSQTDCKSAPAKFGGGPPPPRWIAAPNTLCKPLTQEEIDSSMKAMEKGLLKNMKPVPNPRILITIGTPGSGKSTIAAEIFNEKNVVNFDYDTLIKYHPRNALIHNLPDIEGQPTGYGYAFGWMSCIDGIADLGELLLHRLIALRYNLIVQTHNFDTIVEAKNAGYQCTVVYVQVKVETAQKRARKRAGETGMYLTPTLAAQDDLIAERHKHYIDFAPFYGMWADRFIAVNNDGAHYAAKPPIETGSADLLRKLKDAVASVERVPKKSGAAVTPK